jgi:hypothetical protein
MLCAPVLCGLEFNMRGRWTDAAAQAGLAASETWLLLPARSRLHGLARGVDAAQLLDA